MTVMVIARSVREAQTVCRELALKGAMDASPRSINRYGAGRGLVVTEILVHHSAWPLDDETWANLAPCVMAARLRVILVPDVRNQLAE